MDVAFTPPLKDFHLGEQAEVLIATESRQGAMSLPKTALVTKGKARGVWVVEGSRIRFQEVETGVEDNHFVEITRGIAGNEPIALAAAERMAKFSDGQKVRVRK